MASFSTSDDYDVVVLGGGHAGCEAATAAARLGAKTVLLTDHLDTIARMSCNPAIGGVAKGQIVREIDALGGCMGRAIDATGIQFRLLNRRKGPAMHGPRAQADKQAYQEEIRVAVESQPNLDLRQETVEDLLIEGPSERQRIVGVRVRGDVVYRAEAVVLCAGTFMRGVLHYGSRQLPGGRSGEGTGDGLSRALQRAGFELARFKTGTPPRIDGRHIDHGPMEFQPGDESPTPFSFLTDRIDCQQIPCWITQTNRAVHELVLKNLHRAPMHTGQIASTGPRYCPSFETKVVRFADRDHHQIFLEPEGRRTTEVYVNGLSTSLPPDVQEAMISRIAGLERARIMRYGYAIEYDYVPPEQLKVSLETRLVGGLYLAGQVNGTTGYEEAAGQGLLAGTSAALGLAGKEPLVLGREEAYLGVMVDDLVTRGVDEPYRMFTSRAEYRLLLRGDNADRRLTARAHDLGLIDSARWSRFVEKRASIDRWLGLLDTTRASGALLAKVLQRPESTWADIVEHLPEASMADAEVARQVTHDVKYAGYIDRQNRAVERQRRLARLRLPEDLDYATVPHLRPEAREKLTVHRPTDISQASRISGITPTDLALLTVHLDKNRRSRR